jgi:hypothetical protein
MPALLFSFGILPFDQVSVAGFPELEPRACAAEC